MDIIRIDTNEKNRTAKVRELAREFHLISIDNTLAIRLEMLEPNEHDTFDMREACSAAVLSERLITIAQERDRYHPSFAREPLYTEWIRAIHALFANLVLLLHEQDEGNEMAIRMKPQVDGLVEMAVWIANDWREWFEDEYPARSEAVAKRVAEESGVDTDTAASLLSSVDEQAQYLDSLYSAEPVAPPGFWEGFFGIKL